MGTSLPTSAQTAQMRVVSGFPSTWATAQAACRTFISTRKAHIDEVGSGASVPIDDTVDLTDERRQMILFDLTMFPISHRSYFASLRDALSEQAVDVPAIPAIWQKLVTAIETLFADPTWTYSTNNYVPYWPIRFQTYSDNHRLAPVVGYDRDEIDDPVNYVRGPTGSVDTDSWDTILGGLGTADDLLVFETDNPNGETMFDVYSAWTAGYDADALGGSETQVELASYIIGRLSGMIHDAEANSTDYTISESNLTPPSLVTDIGRVWKTFRDFIDIDVASYLDETIDVFDDDLDTLLSAIS
jgi:hypothetical protein